LDSVLLAFAGAWAWKQGAHVIALGAHEEDYQGYPDCRDEFLFAMESALRLGLSHPAEIWAPLLGMDKMKIIQLALKLGVPLDLTWSCYAGGAKPCGKCDACIRRANAFKALKIKDPWKRRK